MVLKQYYLGCLAHASYLIADEGSGSAAVIDPQRDVEQYLEDAGEFGAVGQQGRASAWSSRSADAGKLLALGAA